VGIGSDFYAGGGAASGGLAGWMNVSEGEHITGELLRRGYSEQDIAKVWGGNLLRVMRATEAVARSCRSSQLQH
jgi:membrane dipeptidase